MEKKCIKCGCVIPNDAFICLHCESENDMQTFRPRIVTNGDRIRAMTNKELVQLGVRLGIVPKWLDAAALEWLESEAKP